MKLSDSKAIKTGQWFANEQIRETDISFISDVAYQNFTDQMAVLSESELNNGKDVVVGGLNVIHDVTLTVDLKTGAAVSSQGAYVNLDIWGFVADVGGVFGVIIPLDQSITFSVGGTNNRIDLVEVRPIEISYNGLNRNFKDPVTGLVTSANVKTRKEYGFEYAVREGIEAASPVADTKTAGWIKIAEVYIATSASSIVQGDIKDVRDSDTWTTEADDTKLSETAVNTVHKSSDGKDHSDVVLNNTHRSSNGSNHGYINQDVQSSATPGFTGITLGSGDTIKKVTISTSNPTGGADGDMWFVREA